MKHRMLISLFHSLSRHSKIVRNLNNQRRQTRWQDLAGHFQLSCSHFLKWGHFLSNGQQARYVFRFSGVEDHSKFFNYRATARRRL